MELATDLILIAALISVGLYGALELVSRIRLRRRTIIVVLKDSPRSSWRGVLWHQGRNYLELRGASYLEAGASVPVDGAVVLPRSNIAWIQDPEEH
jgi:hypothetical protein